jgi:hypothetical protein
MSEGKLQSVSALTNKSQISNRSPSFFVGGLSHLERLWDGLGEHVPGVERGQPEGELVGKVVAGAAGSVALYEGRGPEVF